MSFEASVLIIFFGFPFALYLLWHVINFIDNIFCGVYLSPHHKTIKDKFHEWIRRVYD